MRRLITIGLLAVTAIYAHATVNTDNMVAQCNEVMDSGECRVALDPKDYPNPTVLIVGVGRISTASYLHLRNVGTAKDADGKWSMCRMVREACQAESSDDCKAARALFSQVAPSVRPPGSSNSSTIR